MIRDNKGPMVSVIIPSYNGERFVGEAIESVLNQTYQNFEIILVDDGSTDGSKSVIKPFLKDARIRLIEHEQNKGIPFARNTGIKHSNGRYIAFLDQDDLWLPEKLEKQIAILAQGPSNLGLVFGDIVTASKDGRSLQTSVVPKNINLLPTRSVLKLLFLNNFIPLITVLVKRECVDTIGLLDEHIKGGADDYEWCLLLAAKYRIHYINITLAIHRLHEFNYSNEEKFCHDELAIIGKLVVQEPFLAPLVPKKLGILHYRLGRFYQNSGQFPKARTNLWKAVRYRPSHVKSLLVLLLCCLGHLGNGWLQVYRFMKERMRLSS